MPRRTALQAALETVVLDVIAEEVQQRDRQGRRGARQRVAEAEAARDPLDALRDRLAEIDEQRARLSRMHRRDGDQLAGRLIATLERERGEILPKLAPELAPNATGGGGKTSDAVRR